MTQRGNPRQSSDRQGLAQPVDPLRAEVTAAADSIDVEEWSKVMPVVMAKIPDVRIGKRWVSTPWFLPIGAADPGRSPAPAVGRRFHAWPGMAASAWSRST